MLGAVMSMAAYAIMSAMGWDWTFWTRRWGTSTLDVVVTALRYIDNWCTDHRVEVHSWCTGHRVEVHWLLTTVDVLFTALRNIDSWPQLMYWSPW
jgi:hypothetical protein